MTKRRSNPRPSNVRGKCAPWDEDWLGVHTVFIKNIPKDIQQDELLRHLFGDKPQTVCNFVLYPMDHAKRRSLGMCFLNFPCSENVPKFIADVLTTPWLRVAPEPARLQGLALNLAYAVFSSTISGGTTVRSQPVVFDEAGNQMQLGHAVRRYCTKAIFEEVLARLDDQKEFEAQKPGKDDEAPSQGDSTDTGERAPSSEGDGSGEQEEAEGSGCEQGEAPKQETGSGEQGEVPKQEEGSGEQEEAPKQEEGSGEHEEAPKQEREAGSTQEETLKKEREAGSTQEETLKKDAVLNSPNQDSYSILADSLPEEGLLDLGARLSALEHALKEHLKRPSVTHIVYADDSSSVRAREQVLCYDQAGRLLVPIGRSSRNSSSACTSSADRSRDAHDCRESKPQDTTEDGTGDDDSATGMAAWIRLSETAPDPDAVPLCKFASAV